MQLFVSTAQSLNTVSLDADLHLIVLNSPTKIPFEGRGKYPMPKYN